MTPVHEILLRTRTALSLDSIEFTTLRLEVDQLIVVLDFGDGIHYVYDYWGRLYYIPLPLDENLFEVMDES